MKIRYNDFRVITSDCWDSTYYPPYPPNNPLDTLYRVIPIGSRAHYSKRRCNDTVCCYEKYHVCYIKDENGYVKVLENSIINSSGYYSPKPCDTITCVPDNCMKWIVVPEFHFNVNLLVEDVNKPENCTVNLLQNLYSESLFININCAEIGSVNIEIFDILGNILLRKDYPKNTHSFSGHIALNLNSGVYFCKVSINNKYFSYKQLFIFK
ncbi:MAG: hypothetical protein HW421_1572 [Ignavibacteria bacterium]|nr:hypothetical protein [Ignavibacteria bacterium]